MLKSELTSNQKDVLGFIIKTKSKRGGAPSLQEIQEHFDFKAIGTVQDYLSVLQKKGYIKRSPKARDIEILDHAGIDFDVCETIRLPIIGQVAAGSPILAEENREGYLHVDRSFAKSKDAFLLRVKGNSMVNAHILDGDMVVVAPQKECNNGEIAVCMIEDEATVKRFYKRRGHIELKPENDAFKTITVKPHQSFAVVGKVCGVIRANL